MFRKPKRAAPRKVGRSSTSPPPQDHNGQSSPPPTTATRALTPSRRLIFSPDSPVIIGKHPRKTKLSQSKPQATPSPKPQQKATADPFAQVESAARKRTHIPPTSLPHRSTTTYTNDYLASLKAEQTFTPRTTQSHEDIPHDELGPIIVDPADLSDADPIDLPHDTLPSQQIVSTTSVQQTHIPSATEIAAKKSRRARLAAEQRADEFIGLSDSSSSTDDEDARNLIIHAENAPLRTKQGKEGEREGRLGGNELDDDDFAEGFDEFTEETGRVATTVQKKDVKKEIAEALEVGEEEGSEEDDGTARAYEEAQARKGTYGERGTGKGHREVEEGKKREEAWRAVVERRYVVRPAPTMREVVRRLGERKEGLKTARQEKEKALEGCRREKGEIAEEEERVQVLLKEAGERLQRASQAVQP